jgi:tRNA A37 methylthiotransferase MiaB
MTPTENKFGTAEIFSINDVKGKIYCQCTACLSVWTDFLSWANANPNRMTKNPAEADNIIILGCQVCDLAILNDIRHAEHWMNLVKEGKLSAGKRMWMGGCVTQRFDIELPGWIDRLDVTRVEYQELNDLTLIEYASPFWVKDFGSKNDPFDPGNLFRNHYPLKIGAGCHGKCEYCTIKYTRGKTFHTDADRQVEEFLRHEDVVLIADSPTIKQINDWCDISYKYGKPISIRNIEPNVAIKCSDKIVKLARNGLLPVFHCPVQSNRMDVIDAMGREWAFTKMAVEMIDMLRKWGCKTKFATNVIVDYPIGFDINRTIVPNYDKKWLDEHFDYHVWNPYWDGQWDRPEAERRFKIYIDEERYPL